jgi:gliding motility-associated-like protein
MKFFQITFLLSLIVAIAQAQPTVGKIAHYSFDNCDATDDSGNGSNGTMFGNPTCDCGVKGQALRLDGIDDYVIFTGVVNSVFQTQDFTLSFYFKAQEASAISQDIITKREACSDNTMLNIEYIESLRFLSADLAETGNGSTFLSANGKQTCWHHCVLIRDGKEVELYLDGQLKAKTTTPNLLNLTNAAPLSIGNSPCVNQSVGRFKGLIDEIYVYTTALRPEQVAELFLFPDQIGNRDTILFTGTSVNTFVPNSCATDFQWIPTDFVSDPTSPTTQLSPIDTATYVLKMTDSDFCVTYDTLKINVLDPDALPCDQVFLPKAFTPNGDELNDVFGISNPFIVQQLKTFEIFDRWGNQVFVTNNAFEGWDGSYKSQLLNTGVFIWKLEYSCEGQTKTQTGTVMLMR